MKLKKFTLFIIVTLFSYQAIAQAPSYVPASGLLAWYAFNGNASNSAGAGNNGVINGSATFGTDRHGIANSSYIGNGASAIDIPGNNFPSGNAARSISAWFKSVLPFPAGKREIFATGDTLVPGNLFGMYADSSDAGFESAGSSVSHSFTMDSAWHHIVVTYGTGGAGTSSVKVYLDGQIAATSIINPLSTLTTDTGNIHAIGTLLMPAYAGGWGDSWVGKLDDIGVWNRELTACEVRQLFFGTLVTPMGAISGASTICPGSTTTLSDTVAGGAWSSSNTAAATVGSTGIVTGVAAGTTTITYSLSGGCRVVHSMTVLANPVVDTIKGLAALCVGSSIVLSDSVSGGVWSSSNSAVATINNGTRTVTGVTAGTAIITYTVGTGCGTPAKDTILITVNPVPQPITGTTTFCQGTTTVFSDSTVGGLWTSSAPAIASIDSVTGSIRGVGSGTAIISYTMRTGCGTTTSVTINPNPNAYFVVGGGNYCPAAAGVHVRLSGSEAGIISYQLFDGTFTAGAPVTGTGLALDFGLHTSPGVYTVLATNLSTGCTAAMYGSAIVTADTAMPPPIIPGTITGPSRVCIGASITLTDATASIGGYWWASNFKAVIYDSLTVIGQAKGFDTISFIALNFCVTNDTAIATKVIEIDSLPVVGAINGLSAVCPGATITLSDTTAGGMWTSGDPGTATVSSTGVVTGVTAGVAHIYYTVTNYCGPSVVVKNITVTAPPPSILGTAIVCPGTTTVLSDSVTGGSWSSGAAVIATINSITGVLRGNVPGTATITYTAGGGCKTTRVATVSPLPNAGTISGIPSVCIGTTVLLSDNSAGGIWSSGNTGIATVGSGTGLVGGVALGTVTISYSVTNMCGTAVAAKPMTVILVPFAGTITGPTKVCTGDFVTLSSVAAGGVWSSTNNRIATVNPVTGQVYGDSVAVDTIVYTVTNSCGTAVATRTISVIPSPSPILGFTTACPGSTTALFDTTAGGVWSDTGYYAYATVDSVSGIVSGIAQGTAIISYTIANGCKTTDTVTVPTLPYSGIVNGLSYVCQRATITLSDSVTGGTWSSSNPSVASVSPAGVVRGLAGGTASISYTVINDCGTATTIHPVNVYPSANPGGITGVSDVCIFSVDTLKDRVAGGTWSSGNTSVVTVDATGIITAVGAGTAIISYGVSDFCGPSYAQKTIHVFLPTHVGPITGPAAVCVNDTIRLADTAAGGGWSSSFTTIARINSVGLVTGVKAGTTIISYNNTNVCDTAIALKTVTVNPLPEAGIIKRGIDSVCVGATITLIDTIPGGVWISSNLSAATVDTNGNVTGVSAGTVVITYSVTNICGTDTATRHVLVKDILPAGLITGPPFVCRGDTIRLSDTVLHGAWTSGNTAVATIDSGLVGAVASGTVIISYALTSYCGTATVTKTVLVPPLPASVDGIFNVCEGSTVMIGDLSGGTWQSGNALVATVVSATGLVTGVASGTAIITYSMSLGCTGTTTVDVFSAPEAGTITAPPAVCKNATFTLKETVPDGTWYLNSPIATVDSVTGVVTTTDTGTANVTYQSAYNVHGCRRSTTSSFTVEASPGITTVIKNDACGQGTGSIHIDISGGSAPYSALWQTGFLGTDYGNLQAGTYTVNVKDANNCSDSFSIAVGEDNCGNINIHDVITPNGDGVNDVWVIENIKSYPNAVVQVFDKWGDRVYEARNYNNDWSGKKSNGELLPDGTYFYVIKLNVSGSADIKNVWTGSILIKR